jgi:DNA modification methylase
MVSYQLIQGDCMDVLPTLEAESVQCIVTSPPYYGLRDYGVDGQFGLEQSPEEYIEKMVAVFREVKRVLRNDGTLWLNMGDSYAGTPPGTRGKNAQGIGGDGLYKRYWDRQLSHGEDKNAIYKIPHGLKPKDLIGMPWRLAFALQADGWWLRSDIIWHKPNPMPESVRDRPTKSHEYIFLLTKSAKYYYDAEAVREPSTELPSGNINRKNNHQVDHSNFGTSIPYKPNGTGRNRRTVWTIPTAPYKGAHFATFPPALVEPCILAGSKPGDMILDPFCGSGTTLEVAVHFGRNGIGIELSPEYIELARERIEKVILPMFN